MRRWFLTVSVISLTALGGCGKKAEEAGAPPAAQVAADTSAGGPNINPAAAPGVAFNYSYSFVLPDRAIAVVQETHAAACERLGPTQCRITGMRYTLTDEERISARLEFKLAPQLARAFGKEGIAAVEKASGKLIDEEIGGEDVGATIDSANQTSSDAKTRLAEVEAKLKAGGIGDRARSELEAQASALRNQIAAAHNDKAVAVAQLASTPMIFEYAGDIGFSLGGNPVSEATHSAWASLSAMLWIVLMAVGVALPWALLFALLLFAWRSRPGLKLRAFLFGKGGPPVEKS